MKILITAAFAALLFTTPAFADSSCKDLHMSTKQAVEQNSLPKAVEYHRFDGDTLRKIEKNYNSKNDGAEDSVRNQVAEGIVMFFTDHTGTIVLFDAEGYVCEAGFFPDRQFYKEWMEPFVGEET